MSTESMVFRNYVLITILYISFYLSLCVVVVVGVVGGGPAPDMSSGRRWKGVRTQ